MKKNQIGKIHLTDAGMEQLLKERDATMQEHLNQLNNAQAVKGSALNSVVLAAVQHGGLPPVSQQAAFFEAAKNLATIISDEQLVNRAKGIKALVKELNVHQARDAIVWSCKEAGVDLFDADPRDQAVVKTLVAEH